MGVRENKSEELQMCSSNSTSIGYEFNEHEVGRECSTRAKIFKFNGYKLLLEKAEHVLS